MSPCSNLHAPRTINPTHCWPCAMHVYNATSVCFSLCSGDHLTFTIALIDSFLCLIHYQHGSTLNEVHEHCANDLLSVSASSMLLVPDSLPAWFNSKWSPWTLCKWPAQHLCLIYAASEFNGDNGHRLVNIPTVISLQLLWLLML